MLTLQYLRNHKNEAVERLKIKNFDAETLINEILELDQYRRSIQTENDGKLSLLNKTSKEIGRLFRTGKKDEAEAGRRQVGTLKDEIKQLQQELLETEDKIHDLLIRIPNVPHPDVPEGKGAEDNREIRRGGDLPSLHGNSLPHWELGTRYGILDFELGNTLTGAGFPVFMGKGARLVRALITFFLDEAEKAGYYEIIPPLMVNEASAYATGQLPDKEGQMYTIPSENFYLIPTAEVPVTNLYRDQILEETKLPVKATAYTPCFRREAGSYGKDVRGLNRVHQFDKVEIVRIEKPENSYAALEEMINHVESLVRKLELPYRIVKLCGGDISFTSALTYDFEVFAAAQKKWLEVSSVSNFGSYQANRLKLRFRDNNSRKTRLAHTLNGSALALPRIIAALLENKQTEKGIRIPEVLIPYTGFAIID
ncbi:MAG: serine--tRNA ligase [Chlorobi bacterium]|nr:serine--tRNA ligase [Chlorobiota bacterium]